VASRWDDPRASRALLLGWLAAAFALSGARDLRVLAGAGLLALVLFRRGAARNLGRAARLALPLSAGLSALSWAFLRAVEGAWPPPAPYAALALRAAILAFLGFAVLERARLFRALEPWPTATRLLVVALAQVHALRLLAQDSLQGLRSRLVRRPGARDVVRGAGGITAAMFTLSARNARDVSDALRSRGF
jgi:cobalt/nickel transport system permease protein